MKFGVIGTLKGVTKKVGRGDQRVKIHRVTRVVVSFYIAFEINVDFCMWVFSGLFSLLILFHFNVVFIFLLFLNI